MKKKLFFLAMAACVAMSNVSCSSDSDNGGDNSSPVTLPKPKYADKAASFNIRKGDVEGNKLISLTGLNLTESGKAIIKVTDKEDKNHFTSCDMEVEGDTYIIRKNGKKIGTIKELDSSRAASVASLIIDLVVEIPFLGEQKFTTSDPVVVSKVVDVVAGIVNTTNIARTWTVQTMKLICEGDVDFSMTEKSGNLKVFVKEAQDRGANLTEEEQDELSKTIHGITLDKTGMFAIEYSDGLTEVCTWNWTNNSQDLLSLLGSEFGNKFLSEKSNVEVKFSTSGCTFTMTTNITGQKKYKATLVIVLK